MVLKIVNRETAAILDLKPALTKQILAYVNGDNRAIAHTPERIIALQTLRGQSILSRFGNTSKHTRSSPLTCSNAQLTLTVSGSAIGRRQQQAMCIRSLLS
ncbi:hypothetical protein S7335_5432 [Synechococcus sp. PCC 7335]|uniref:hypothetical protein n=1 Tax=Synechococcus sp. (strain ATCC 29403 / PCC 7335) TaxID=91464 RepID=UPI00017ED91D|nr:hypothetical protein [Synechococcus sp. PCC 7335]EDX87722.1 hypothetical protein S7335_5432 [Synechococcus sp. PCC 7335]